MIKIISDKLGQSDLEKCSQAWIDFISVQQGPDETAQSFVARFEKIESQLRNVNIIIPPKALAIHLMNKSSMEPQSKENVLTKTNINDAKEIYETMKKSIREMKGNLTTSSKLNENSVQNKTYYGSNSHRKRDEYNSNHGFHRRDRSNYNNHYSRSSSRSRRR